MSRKFKLNSLVYESAKKMKLKRVQIKCDPSLTNTLDFSNVAAYEGYILEEGIETVSVMIIKQDLPVVEVPTKTATQTDEPNLNSFKLASFKQYITKSFQSGDPLIGQLKNANSVEEIESIMVQNNVSTEKFIQILRRFVNGKLISEDVAPPSFMQNAGQFASNAAKGTLGALANAGQTASKINDLSTQLKQGNYGQIAKSVSDQWDTAKEQQIIKSLQKLNWPQGLPKKGTNIKIINRNNPKIDNKLIQITQIQVVKENTLYYGSVLGIASPLGTIGIIITVPNDPVMNHAANIKFTENGSISNTLNKYPTRGDQYLIQFSLKRRQFEIVEDFLGVTSASFKEKELTVKCEKTNKVDEVGTFLCVSRFPSQLWMQQVRAKLVTVPELNPTDKMYYAHATPV